MPTEGASLQNTARLFLSVFRSKDPGGLLHPRAQSPGIVPIVVIDRLGRLAPGTDFVRDRS